MFIFLSCSGYNQSLNEKLENKDFWEIVVIGPGNGLPIDKYNIITDFYIGSQDYNQNKKKECSYQAVLNLAKKKVSKLGGHAIKITEIKYPDNLYPDCYRIYGIALKLKVARYNFIIDSLNN